MTETDELREQLRAVTRERNEYHAQLTDLRLHTLEANHLDHEDRIRSVEGVAIKFNTLYAMFAGNGLMSIIILFKLFVGNNAS